MKLNLKDRDTQLDIAFSAALCITLASGKLSFDAFVGLVHAVSLPADTAWLHMPAVELFMILGALVYRMRRTSGKRGVKHNAFPVVYMFAGMLISLVVNITDAVAPAITPGSDVYFVIRGAFAAIVPLAMIGAVHMLSELLGMYDVRKRVVRTPVRSANVGATAAANTDATASANADATPAATDDANAATVNDAVPIARNAIPVRCPCPECKGARQTRGTAYRHCKKHDIDYGRIEIIEATA